MRQRVRNQPRRVALQISSALVDLDVRRLHSLPVWLVDVVLGADVCKVHEHGRDVGHGVVPVRDAVISAGLRGDVVCKLDAGHARSTEGVQGYWEA